MRNLFLIAFFSLLAINAFGQPKWEITAIGVGPVQLGNSLTKTRSEVSKYYTTVDNEDEGFDVFSGTTKLISIWSKHNDGNIGMIMIFSDQFETADGLRVGLTISEVEQIRDDFYFIGDQMSEQEYFKPAELQTPSEDFYKYLNLLYFKSNEGKKLVDNFKYDEQTDTFTSKKYRTNGYLEYFLIYEW